MTLTRWKWMTRKIFLDKESGAGNCRPSSKSHLRRKEPPKWNEFLEADIETFSDVGFESNAGYTPMRTALLLRFYCLPIPLTEGKHRS